MVEIGCYGDCSAEHVARVEVDCERARSRRGLCVVALDAADESLRVLQRQVGVDGQIIA